MAIDQKVMEEVQEAKQPIVMSMVDEDLNVLERKVFGSKDVEAVLMDTQARLEEIYDQLSKVGLDQYHGLLGEIMGYLASSGVIGGNKRMKGKRKNAAKALARVESQANKARMGVKSANTEYGRCLTTFYDADRLMSGYGAQLESLQTLKEEKRQELAEAKSASNPNDRRYLEIPIELGNIDSDIMTTDYKMKRAAGQVKILDKRLNAVDYKRKVAMQQVSILGNMAGTLETILAIADSSLGEGVNPLETLKVLNYSAETVKGLEDYVNIVNSHRGEMQQLMNELPGLLEERFNVDNFDLTEVAIVETDKLIADAKKAVERRLNAY